MDPTQKGLCGVLACSSPATLVLACHWPTQYEASGWCLAFAIVTVLVFTAATHRPSLRRRQRIARHRRRAWSFVPPGALLTLVSACTSLPDVKPFAATTLTLEAAVDASFEAAADAQQQMAALLEVPAGHPAEEALAPRRQQYAEAAASIRTDGEHRATLLRALTDYTDALAAIVDAAATSGSNVGALGDSVLKLVGTFTASPLPTVANGALELGKLVVREAITIKAARDLQAGLDAADPVVQAAAKLLLADVASLRQAVATKPAAANAAIQLAGGELYRHQRRHLRTLEARRAALLASIDGLAADVDIESHASSANLLDVERQLEAARRAVAPIEARRNAVLDGLAASEELLRKLEEGIEAWAQAHADLAVAARQGRAINLRRLVQVALEAKGIIDRMQHAKEVRDAG